MTITIYSVYQELKNYDPDKKDNVHIENKLIEKDYLEYRNSVIQEIFLPLSIGIITIIVVIAFLKGYQWGRIVLTVFMVTAMIDGVRGIVLNDAPVLSGFKFTIQGIIFFILIFSSKVKSYFKTAKQIRMENK
jgi:hypothetical protein